MRSARSGLIAIVVSLAVILAAGVAAQARQYRARLSPIPLDLAMHATVAGSGAVTATLNGNTLTVNGTFAGLKTAATAVRLHASLRPGMRGAPIGDLKASAGTSGAITGSIELNADQLAALTSSRVYVQLHSEKAPDGNLWGWLYLQEGKK